MGANMEEKPNDNCSLCVRCLLLQLGLFYFSCLRGYNVNYTRPAGVHNNQSEQSKQTLLELAHLNTLGIETCIDCVSKVIQKSPPTLSRKQ